MTQTMFLHLDQSFTFGPKEQYIAYESFVFSGGEPHIKITSDLNEVQRVIISIRIRNFEQVGLLLLAVDALRRMGVQELQLVLPYFPGARQDRVMVPGEPLTVKVFAQLINQMQLDKVLVFDPHSEVMVALLDRVQVLSPKAFIQDVCARIGKEDLILVAPDAGAVKRTESLAKAIGIQEVISCSKRRDLNTGRIVSYTIHVDNLVGKKLLVVDDICDGGATFLLLAKAIREKGGEDPFLAISHGIFSKGTEALLKEYNQIHYTDAFPNSAKDVHIYSLGQDIEKALGI